MSGAAGALAFSLVLLAGCARSPQARLANELLRGTGEVELPVGTLVVDRELVIPEGAHDLEIRGNASGSVLEAAAGFKGRGVFYAKGATNLRLAGFHINGNRAALEKPIGLPTGDVRFARYYTNNGIVIEGSTRVTVSGVSFSGVANYALIVSASAGVTIENVRVDGSGSRGLSGHNNASGGILIEEGTHDFVVRGCTLRLVRGNGIWTHSFYHSPRNANGVIQDNVIEEAARDAIQVGHATNVKVERNRGRRIGYPIEMVDMATSAVPVALDTAGNVDHSIYAGNTFEDVNGKCIDLDGFHDGEVRDNSCVSRLPAREYPDAQFGIVFNDANPDFEPGNVTVAGNLIDGAGFGGLFLLGSHNVITGNRLLNLNRAHCTGDPAVPRCNYLTEQPDLLRSGIYLTSAGARPVHTTDNQITGNRISGFGMDRWCIAAAPGVSLRGNRIVGNECSGRNGR